MTPIVNGLQAEYGDRVAFVQFNVDTPEGARVQQRYSLRGHPAYVLVDSRGQVTWQAVGQVSEDELRAHIETLLAAR